MTALVAFILGALAIAAAALPAAAQGPSAAEPFIIDAGLLATNKIATTDAEMTSEEAAEEGDALFARPAHDAALDDNEKAALMAELAALEKKSDGGLETRAQHLARRARRGLVIAQPKPFADRYSGVFMQSSRDTKFVSGLSYNNFVSYWSAQGRLGNRLTDIEVRTVGNTFEYSGVFSPGTGAYALWVGVDWSNFVAKWKEFAEDDLRLIGRLPRHGRSSDPPSSSIPVGTARVLVYPCTVRQLSHATQCPTHATCLPMHRCGNVHVSRWQDPSVHRRFHRGHGRIRAVLGHMVQLQRQPQGACQEEGVPRRH